MHQISSHRRHSCLPFCVVCKACTDIETRIRKRTCIQELKCHSVSNLTEVQIGKFHVIVSSVCVLCGKREV
jgi:hypothetical protein